MNAGWVQAMGTVLAEGSDGKDFTPVSVSPGLAGFVAMFLIAGATVLLILDMSRRIRRSQARERVEQRMREQDGQPEADEDGTCGDADRENGPEDRESHRPEG